MLTRARVGTVAKYLVVGVLSVIVDVGGLWLLHGIWAVLLPIAAAVSFLASFAVNFTLNQRWTFRATATRTPTQLLRFTTLVIVNTVLTSVGVTAITGTGVDYRVAKLIMIVVLTAANFVILRLWVFPAGQVSDDVHVAPGH